MSIFDDIKNFVVKVFWPDVATIPGRNAAILYGTVGAGWLSGSYALNFVLLYFFGKGLSYEPEDDLDLIIVLAIFFALAAILGFLAWRIWKCAGHVSASISLVLVLLAVVSMWTGDPGRGVIEGIIFTLLAINGVRGTLALRKSLKERQTDLRQRGEIP
jgi:hypothetical protein